MVWIFARLLVKFLPSLFTVKYTKSLPKNQLAVEILDNLANFPNCILLTRVGQFYEVSSTK